MYALVVSNDYGQIEKVVKCRTMAEVQMVLEVLQPDLKNADFLFQNNSVSFRGKTYTFSALTHVDNVLNLEHV